VALVAPVGQDVRMTQRHLVVTVAGVDRQDLEELEAASRRLRDELLELDGIRIDAVPDQPSRDPTRAVAEVLAAFAIGLYLVRPVVKEVAGVINSWLQRHRDKKVVVTFPDGSQFEINGHDTEGTRDLIGKIEKTIQS
jgi:hypothetical protein